MKTLKNITSCLLLLALLGCSNTRVYFKETSAQPLEKKIDKVLLVFEGASIYSQYFQRLGTDLTASLEKQGVISQSFYKGMMVYGQKSMQEEQVLLVAELESFQPTYLLEIKQDLNLVYYSPAKNVFFNDTGKRSKSEFKLELKPIANLDTVYWEGNLMVVSEKVFGDKIASGSVHQAKFKVMGALMKNDYISSPSKTK